MLSDKLYGASTEEYKKEDYVTEVNVYEVIFDIGDSI